MESKRHQSISDLIEHSFKQYSDLPAYTCFGQTLSYRQLDDLSRKFASYLQHHTDLKPGDRIAIQLPNIFQYPVAICGAIRAGLVLVNTNPLYTKRELTHQLRDSGAKALIVLANVANVAADVVSDTDVETVIVTDLGDLLTPMKRTLVNFVVKKVKKLVPPYHFARSIGLREMLSKGDQPLRPIPEPNPDDIFVLQYTGGTTGVAKGAMLTQANLCANVYQLLAHMNKLFKTQSQIVVAALPLYHIFAFNLHALCSFSQGAHTILIPNPRDIKSFIKAIKPYRVSTFIAVNTLYNALVRDPDFAKLDFSELKTSAAGGMAVTEEVFKRWKQVTGNEICEGYGLTETSPVIITNPDDKIQRGTVGLPLVETEIRLIDESGADVPDGKEGEIAARGPQVMKGYWQRPKATAEVLSEDGWFRTGDIGIQQSDGYYRIVDRKKDTIVVSGFNVYPNEVEDVVSLFPGVLECAAIGVRSEETGEAVKLFVVSNGQDLNKDDMIAHCRQSLTGYKVPKIIEFVSELPKTNVGKILRRVLRDAELKKSESEKV